MKNELRTTLFALLATVASPALATPRTFVSSTGLDTNPCSITQPCRSFATAAAKTSLYGEIIVLDSAGYGPVTISQPLKISAPPGIYAGITVPAGADGITVESDDRGVTALRGLTLNGASGTNGIHVLTGSWVEVDGCVIEGLTQSGILLEGNAKTLIRNTRFTDNGRAVRVVEAASVAIDGISVFKSTDPDSGAVDVVATQDGVSVDVSVSNSTFGRVATAVKASNGGNGLVKVAVSNVTMHSVGAGIFASDGGPGHVVITASENFISAGTGIHVDGPNVTLVATGNRIKADGNGIENPALDSTMITLQNNTIVGDVADVSGSLVTRSLR